MNLGRHLENVIRKTENVVDDSLRQRIKSPANLNKTEDLKTMLAMKHKLKNLEDNCEHAFLSFIKFSSAYCSL